MMTRLAAIALLISASAASATRARLVLVLDAGATDDNTLAVVGPLVTKALTRKGYDVIGGNEVQAFARARGAKTAAQVGPATANALMKQFSGDAVMTVAIGFVLDARDRKRGPRASPAAGFIARKLTAERVVWRGSIGVIDDAVYEPGTIRKPLASRAMTRLFWSLPRGTSEPLAYNEAEFEDGTEAPPPKEAGVPNYDILLERLRNDRAGPRFRLKLQRR